MKTIVTIILICATLICFGQKKADNKKQIDQSDSAFNKIVLQPSEQMTIADHDILIKTQKELQKEFGIRQDEYNNFIRRVLVANKIPLDRVSANGDSLKITSLEIIVKLKSKK